jgi:ribosomal protein S6--L-glutamate ligase
MKLFFMLVRRIPPGASPVLLEVYGILARRGYTVEHGIAEEVVLRSDRLDAEHDLYVLKSHTELSLSLAGVLHARGARILNPYLNCMAAQDKIVASSRLRSAGIPVPSTWVTADLSLLSEVVDCGPLIVKPHRGHRGQGITVVKDRRDLASLPAPESPVVVQEYIRGKGEDLKVYVVGEEVFAVRKPFSAHSFSKPGRACPVSPEVRDIALRCGLAFGLALYGLDMIESEGGPVVVDVNYFPGYKGVPGAAPLIADYIDGYATGRTVLELPQVLGEDTRTMVG